MSKDKILIKEILKNNQNNKFGIINIIVKKQEKNVKKKVNLKNIKFWYPKIIINMLFLLHLFRFLLSASCSNLRKMEEAENYIVYYIKGNGDYQQIFTQNIEMPSKIIVNGAVMQEISYNYELVRELNKVKIIWNKPISTCSKMFYNLINIIEVSLYNFDSSQVTDMSSMFYGCESLELIDFEDIDTRLVKSMDNMFSNCKSLVSLDLTFFDTSQVISMSSMFNGCSSLKTLDLSNFNTKSLVRMEYMFNNAESLISLDLSNFNITLVEGITQAFYGCKSLIYINLISFVENPNFFLVVNNIISEDNKDLIYCIDEKKSSNISNEIKKVSIHNDCTNICFSEARKLIVEKKICINNCKKDDTYKYEFNNICYNTSQHSDYIDPYDENIEEKIDETEYNENNENIKDKESGNNQIFLNFSIVDFFKESQNINNDDPLKKDQIIKSIKQNLINGSLDNLLINLTNSEKKDLIANDDNTIYQITTTKNQKNKKYTNISTVNLGDCENRLKDIYGIDKNLSLLIFKVDYYETGLLIPIIGYELYHPINKSQLDLNYCKDIFVKLNIPVSIDENKEYKHDPNSEYYNDECFAYTTENGTDILLEDRKIEYVDKKLSLCENNCTYKGYSEDDKKVLCECERKTKIDFISEIINNKNILSNDFSNDSLKSNINSMKCTKTLFTKDGLIKNIGSYLLLFTIIFYMISAIIFYKCGYQIIDDTIQKILKLKCKSKNTNKKNIFYDAQKQNKSHKKSKKKKKNSLRISNPQKKSKIENYLKSLNLVKVVYHQT